LGIHIGEDANTLKKNIMKRLILLLLVLGISGGTAYYLNQKNKYLKYSSGVTPDRDFAIKTLDGITNIVLTHKKLQPIQFQRKGNTWIINNKYEANASVVRNMTDVLTRMELRFTPAKAANATVRKDIANSGIKVQIYADDDKPFKTYYIATDTKDNDGTFMMMEGAEQAYVMYLPGLGQGFRSRFEQPLASYRDIYIYKEDKQNIKSITIRYPKNDASSFIMENLGEKQVVKSPLPNVAPPRPEINRIVGNKFISNFSSLGAEGLMENFEKKDSLLKTIPFATVEVVRKDGTTSKNTFYVYDEFLEGGSPSRSPIDMPKIGRYFLHTQNGDLYVCQNHVFKKIFLDFSDFYK
jgi:hypothetical protein